MTPTGVESVQYLAVRDGKAIFKRRTVNVETGATTMNKAGLAMSTAQAATLLALIPAHRQRSERPQ